MKRIFRYDHEKCKVVEVTGQLQPLRQQVGPAIGAYGEGSPLLSQSLGCHPDQVREYHEELRHNGIVGATVRSDGAVEFTSRKARRNAMKFNRCHDHDGGYGDG